MSSIEHKFEIKQEEQKTDFPNFRELTQSLPDITTPLEQREVKGENLTLETLTSYDFNMLGQMLNDKKTAQSYLENLLNISPDAFSDLDEKGIKNLILVAASNIDPDETIPHKLIMKLIPLMARFPKESLIWADHLKNHDLRKEFLIQLYKAGPKKGINSGNIACSIAAILFVQTKQKMNPWFDIAFKHYAEISDHLSQNTHTDQVILDLLKETSYQAALIAFDHSNTVQSAMTYLKRALSLGHPQAPALLERACLGDLIQINYTSFTTLKTDQLTSLLSRHWSISSIYTELNQPQNALKYQKFIALIFASMQEKDIQTYFNSFQDPQIRKNMVIAVLETVFNVGTELYTEYRSVTIEERLKIQDKRAMSTGLLQNVISRGKNETGYILAPEQIQSSLDHLALLTIDDLFLIKDKDLRKKSIVKAFTYIDQGLKIKVSEQKRNITLKIQRQLENFVMNTLQDKEDQNHPQVLCFLAELFAQAELFEMSLNCLGRAVAEGSLKGVQMLLVAVKDLEQDDAKELLLSSELKPFLQKAGEVPDTKFQNVLKEVLRYAI